MNRASTVSALLVASLPCSAAHPMVVPLSSLAAHGQEAEETSDRDGIQIDTRPTAAVGMFVVTTDETSLMRDEQILVTLEKGTRLTVSAIRGDQVRAEVEAGGRKQVGWVHIGHVMVVPDPRSRLCGPSDIGELAKSPGIGEESRWRKILADYTRVTENGAVVLSMDSALLLARIHSPLYQRQLEALYRSSLDVGTERADQRRSGEAGYNEEAETVLRNNLRAFSRFRQGFYTHVAIGELGVNELAAVGDRGTDELQFRLTGRGGLGGGGGAGTVGGFIGLLQRLQQIRNTEDNLNLQRRTLSHLEALHQVGLIDVVQVDQFRQSAETERSRLLQNRNGLRFALDCYKTDTLGLPPDLPIKLDDSLIRQFQLVAREATAIEESIVDLQDRVGELSDDAGNLRADVDVETIRQILTYTFQLVEPARHQLDNVEPDLDRMDEEVPVRERTMTHEERKEFQRDRERLREEFADLRQQFKEAKSELTALRDGLSEETKETTVDGSVDWLGGLHRFVQRSILIQARACLEAIAVETIKLRSQDAFEIALTNRLDIMTARGELARRARDIAALRADPDSGPDAKSRFRQALIDYRRDRRQFIQTLDGVHIGLRQTLRSLEELRVNLEIQRRAVAIAIRRVDMTRAAFYAPIRPPRPGERPAQSGPTSATTLATTLSVLRDSQDKLMSIWINHLASRMVLLRDLGIMKLDEEGRWVDFTCE